MAEQSSARLPFLNALKGLSSAQKFGELVFWSNDQTLQEDDGGVERLLEQVSNGTLAEDRHRAMTELQDAMAESFSAQLAFGVMGFPVIISVLKEERHDVDMVRSALETLINALGTTEHYSAGDKSQVQPGIVNSEMLARESGSISLFLSLLDEEDFYIRYYSLRLLTMLSRNCSSRLQEAMLAIPQGISRLMDMVQDREVIRNEALLLLTHLTRSAEEIQKIVVFEGAFEKIFNIIMEEGGCEGGIVVQDCLELLNNIIRNSPANQTFLRETLGIQPIASLLKLRRNALNFSHQKTVNLLRILETTMLLISSNMENGSQNNANVVANQTALAQSDVLDHLLVLAVEGRISDVSVHCAALRCIGDLVHGHQRNCNLLTSKMVGEEPDAEPALLCILRMLLNTLDLDECISAECVIQCFFEGNPDGQIALASTVTPIPDSYTAGNKEWEDDKNISFGSMLLFTFSFGNRRNGFEATCRATCVFTHMLKGNIQCKEKVSQILMGTPSMLASPNHLMCICMRYLAAASPSQEENTANKLWVEPILMRFLITWLFDCPAAVASFLERMAHVTYLIELLANSSLSSVHVSGLAAVLLGECIVYNTYETSDKSALTIVDIITQQVGFTTYFSRWDNLQSDAMFSSATLQLRFPKPLTRLRVAAVGSIDKSEAMEDQSEEKEIIATFYDSEFVELIQNLDILVREKVVHLLGKPKSKTIFTPLDSERQNGESEAEYIFRLQHLVQKQSQVLEEIIARNTALVQQLASKERGSGLAAESGDTSALLQALEESIHMTSEPYANSKSVEEYKKIIETFQKRLFDVEAEVSWYKQVAEKNEAELKSLSDAYNSLEQENYKLDVEVRKFRSTVEGTSMVFTPAELEGAKEQGRREAQKESEAEMGDLLVCLGQEESKVRKLRARLEELGEDVDTLLEGIGEEQDDEADDEE